MNEQLTARQLAEWEAYNIIDPIGEERRDFNFAMLTSSITNIAISAFGGKKSSKLTKIKDFMPKWGEDGKATEQQSSEEMRNNLMSLIGGKRKKK